MDELEEEKLRNQFQVASFYCFMAIKEEMIPSLIKMLTFKAQEQLVLGSILLASEGVNGTICGTVEGVASLLYVLESCFSENHFQVKISWTSEQAFKRFKVRKKAEIVTMGVGNVDPRRTVGIYVDPLEWNIFLKDPDTLVIDTRNEYEIAIGGFEGSLNPHTDCFRDFPSWAENNLRPLVKETAPNRIAMFCTGGIRCEKATSYLKTSGFSEVHHLRGGILSYLEEVPKNESLWSGECFVFDQRVALNENLLPGTHRLCHACGMPLNPEDRKNLSYIRGVQCHHCKNKFNAQDRSRFAERQKQFDIRLQDSSLNTSKNKF